MTAAPAGDDYGAVTPELVAHAIRHRLVLVVGLPLATFLVFQLLQGPEPLRVEAGVTLALAIPPELVIPGSDASAAKVGETLIDDIARIVVGSVFEAAVERRLEDGSTGQASGLGLGASLSATDRHRVLDVWAAAQASGGDPAEVERISARVRAVVAAAAAELVENGDSWFSLLGADAARLRLVSGPSVRLAGPSLRSRLEKPIRLGLAAAVAVALAVILELRGGVIRTATGSNVAGESLGAIPRRPSRGARNASPGRGTG